MIFVVGGTGTIGTGVVRELLQRGQAVRALARSEDAAAVLREQGAEPVLGDVSDPDSLVTALQGCDHAFFVLPSGPEQGTLEEGFVEAAKAAGVEHVVKGSVLAVGADSDLILGRWHAPGEVALERSGLDWTFLRPNGFCQNSLRDAPLIKDQGRFFSPLGDARVSWVDARDISEVAAVALTEAGHAGRAYELTGPAALSHGELAEALSRAAGREVGYTAVPDATAREGMVGAGIPPVYADALIELFEFYRRGEAEAVSPGVEEALGRAPRSFDDFARDHAEAFR